MSGNMPFKLGENLVLCQRCGFKRYASQVTKNWTGLIVCKPEVKQGCFEHRHPQDFIRGAKEDISPEVTNPRGTDQYATWTPIATTVGVQETTIPGNTSGQFGI
mgnify:CR=1 FL=1